MHPVRRLLGIETDRPDGPYCYDDLSGLVVEGGQVVEVRYPVPAPTPMLPKWVIDAAIERASQSQMTLPLGEARLSDAKRIDQIRNM